MILYEVIRPKTTGKVRYTLWPLDGVRHCSSAHHRQESGEQKQWPHTSSPVPKKGKRSSILNDPGSAIAKLYTPIIPCWKKCHGASSFLFLQTQSLTQMCITCVLRAAAGLPHVWVQLRGCVLFVFGPCSFPLLTHWALISHVENEANVDICIFFPCRAIICFSCFPVSSLRRRSILCALLSVEERAKLFSGSERKRGGRQWKEEAFRGNGMCPVRGLREVFTDPNHS